MQPIVLFINPVTSDICLFYPDSAAIKLVQVTDKQLIAVDLQKYQGRKNTQNSHNLPPTAPSPLCYVSLDFHYCA